MAMPILKGGLRLKDAQVVQPLQTCLHASTDSNPIGIGDPVTLAGGSGQIANGSYAPTVAVVQSNSTPLYGVCEGVLREFVTTGMNLDSRYAPASTAMYVLVRKANTEDVYAISEDAVGGAMPVTKVGDNASLIGTGSAFTTCDTITGQSTLMLQSSSVTTTDTLQLKVIGFEDRPDNTPGVANASILVQLNLIQTSGPGGTAVNGVV